MAHGPPFDRVPDLLGAGVVQVWFTDPPGAIVQLSQPSRGTKEMAEWLVGPGFTRVHGRFPAQELTLVLDLSLMEGRDSAAREVIIGKARESGRMFARVIMIPPLKASSVYMATLHAAIALFKALGRDISIERRLKDVIAQCDLKPAPSSDE